MPNIDIAWQHHQGQEDETAFCEVPLIDGAVLYCEIVRAGGLVRPAWRIWKREPDGKETELGKSPSEVPWMPVMPEDWPEKRERLKEQASEWIRGLLTSNPTMLPR